MEQWKEFKLGDVLTIKYGKDHKQLADGDIPIYGSGGIMRYGERSLYEGPSILIPRKGSLNNIMYSDKPFWTVDTMFWTIINEEIANPLFVYYSICKKDFASLNVGSAVPSLTIPVIEDVDILLPSKSTQDKIVSILKSLDEKIEVNRRINENLEQEAQALFKSWFVDFEPFKDQPFVESELGMIPKGWRVVSLADLMDYSGGSQPPASEFIDEEREGYIRFIQIRDYASDSHVTYIPISKKNKLCDVRDIMIARYGASLGRICYGLKGAYNVALAKVYPTKNHYLEILRCYLNTREFYEGINQKGNRAVQAGFNKSDIQSFLLPIPNNEEIIVKFNELCSSMFDSRLSNDIESRRLAELRDTLLPRLMSGELEIKE